MAIAIAQWHVKKYSVVGGVLQLRSGLVNRSIRVVPITRITALAASQSLTQRLVGVWGLDVQSPGDRHGSAVTLSACRAVGLTSSAPPSSPVTGQYPPTRHRALARRPFNATGPGGVPRWPLPPPMASG